MAVESVHMRITLTLVLFLIIGLIEGCSSNNNRAVLDSYPGFSCLSPSTIKYEAWGQNGLSKACVDAQGAKDGQFWTTEMGRFFLRGFYKSGKESGTWEFIDKEGVVTRKVMTKQS